MYRSVVFLLLLLAGHASGQGINLEVKGEGVRVVKVDKIIVVKEDLTVVSSFPFTVSAPPGSALYFWSFPSTASAVDRGDKLEITSAAKGALTISVKAVSADFDKKIFVTQIGNVTFAIGDVPPTPPIPPIPPVDPPFPPKPPVPPVPPVDPAPIPSPGFRVLVVYETSDLAKLPRTQISIFTAVEVRQYLESKCIKGPDGKTPEYKFLDKDVSLDKESAIWQGAFARPRAVLPWAIISNGTTGFEGPLPSTIEGFLQLLKKYGG